MKKEMKAYLVNKGILVADGEVRPADEVFATIVMLRAAFGVEVTEGDTMATPAMVEEVADAIGKFAPDPFYKGFPRSVRQLTSDKLRFDQWLHYMQTYGFGDFSEVGHSVMETYFEREPFAEVTERREFRIVTEEAAARIATEICDSLVASTRPLSVEQFGFLMDNIKELGYRPAKIASKNTAIQLLCDLREMEMAQNLKLSDVIDVVDYINYKDYGNKRFKLNLRNADRKFIKALIDDRLTNGYADVTECYERKAKWAGLLHHIHYSPKTVGGRRFVKDMRGKGNLSVYSFFEKAMADGDPVKAAHILRASKGSGAVIRNLNYMASRCTDMCQVGNIVNFIGTENEIVLLQLMMEYATEQKQVPRTFTFTKYNQMKVHRELPQESERRKTILADDVRKYLSKAVERKLSSALYGRLGRVYIDPAMENIALPLQETAANGGFGVLPKGSRLHIPEGKKIRAFTYWEKVDDIDLACFGITKNGRQKEFSWRNMAYQQSDAITYSGDETSGFNGGSEFFDIDVEKFREMYPDIEYIVFTDNVYSYKTFNECVCRAGYMVRDIDDSGEIFEPKTVKSSFAVNGDGTFAYLFAIDLKANDFVWLNVARDSRCHVAGTTEMDFLRKYVFATETMNVAKLFRMMAMEIVDNPADADVVVSDNASGSNVIRSCDFEEIMALMN